MESISIGSSSLSHGHGLITHRLESSQVGGIEGTSQAARHQALHQEGDTENVHASVTENLDLGGDGPSVILAESAGDGGTKLSTRLADTEP